MLQRFIEASRNPAPPKTPLEKEVIKIPHALNSSSKEKVEENDWRDLKTQNFEQNLGNIAQSSHDMLKIQAQTFHNLTQAGKGSILKEEARQSLLKIMGAKDKKIESSKNNIKEDRQVQKILLQA